MIAWATNNEFFVMFDSIKTMIATIDMILLFERLIANRIVYARFRSRRDLL